MSEWQPIELAEKNKTYLLWADNELYLGYWVEPVNSWNEGNWWAEGGQITVKPTHCMELPSGPDTLPSKSEH